MSLHRVCTYVAIQLNRHTCIATFLCLLIDKDPTSITVAQQVGENFNNKV